MHHETPAQRHLRLAAATLDDKFTAPGGHAFMTGIQALIRLLINQRMRDQAAGLRTAGFVSGYRGSPLGPLDKNLWKARAHLEAQHIRFQPGVNEELGATAVMGSQQLELFPGAQYQGVFGLWYGKGPGVDRCADVFKHGNYAGSARHGGVLVVAGDDHGAYSSTIPHQSEQLFISCAMPVLHPASPQDILDLGVHAWALSRFSGCWVGFKTVADTVEASALLDVDPQRVSVVLPEDFVMPPAGLGIRHPDVRFEQEARMVGYKLPAVLAYVRANDLNPIVFSPRRARIGIVATGKAWHDVRKALDDLGIDPAQMEAIGLRLCKVNVPWPLEPEGMAAFARGLDEIIVVEEKKPLIESQLKEQLYASGARPRVIGKDVAPADPAFDRRLLLSEKLDLTPSHVALLIADRVRPWFATERISQRVRDIETRLDAARRDQIDLDRLAWYCSGCPHNTSTRVPEGSVALAGIGCHWMAHWIYPESTRTTTQMGGEGATWAGVAPFTHGKHVFANLGDGTYFHSGSLAIRQAVGAGIDITYKILYNDAVAMTGGQPVDGSLPIPTLIAQLRAEGVQRIELVSDHPERYDAAALGVPLHHRSELDQVQRELREVKGVSVLIYEQTCAAEKTRRRKRDAFPDPPIRLVINEAVCEGCGDCGEQSNCTALVPVETELGRKRAIDQTRCTKDYSCVQGFCPSFVSVEGGRLRKGRADNDRSLLDERLSTLPQPQLPALDRPCNVLITGIGGTGVLTTTAILGVAAQLDGIGVLTLDMTGMSQKNGGVTSHLHFAREQAELSAARVDIADADTVLALDPLVAARSDALARVAPGRTIFVGNSAQTMPGQFTHDPDLRFPVERLREVVAGSVGDDRAHWLDLTGIATRIFGNAMPANAMMIGYAWQRGLLPLTCEAIERAIELNGVAVEDNLAAFRWGRLAAHDLAAVQRIGVPAQPIQLSARRAGKLETLIVDRVERLTAYQNAAYARRYIDLVRRVQHVERNRVAGATALTQAVARAYFKLLAYKDEYEVARLYVESGFFERIAQQFEGDYRVALHLAPPILAQRDPRTGEPRKRRFGPWIVPVFRALAKLKGLRGTPLDPFGYTAERRMERRLIEEYEQMLERVLTRLDGSNHAVAVKIAQLPEQVRGFGHVKAKSVAKMQRERDALMSEFDRPVASAA
jgi:indolepyruvate ferredoxin oxidoreductase